MSPSDYRALFLDFNHTCLLSTQSPDSTIIYKKNLDKYIKKHDIINQVNNIQNKIDFKLYQSLIDPKSIKLTNL